MRSRRLVDGLGCRSLIDVEKRTVGVELERLVQAIHADG